MNAHAAALGRAAAPRRLLSVADLGRMIDAGIIADDERIELIDGELIAMNAKRFAHDYLKSSLVELFVRATPTDIYCGIEGSLRLDAHTLVEPDILLCRRDRLAVSPEGYLAVSSPDLLLLIEVADNSLRKDRTVKARLYARHGVPEYWIVDVNKRQIWRHREPGSSGYGLVDRIAEGETLHPGAPALAGIGVRLADLA